MADRLWRVEFAEGPRYVGLHEAAEIRQERAAFSQAIGVQEGRWVSVSEEMDGVRALALLTRLAQGNEVPSDPEYGCNGYRMWAATSFRYGIERWASFDLKLEQLEPDDLALLDRLAGEAGMTGVKRAKGET